MNLGIIWEHRLQLLGGKTQEPPFKTLEAAYAEADALRKRGDRVVAVLSTPKQIVTTCEGGVC